MSQISADTYVPIGFVAIAISATLQVAKFMYSKKNEAKSKPEQDGNVMADLRELRVRVESAERTIEEQTQRHNKADERWDAVKDSLSQIKERLGIIEHDVQTL